MPFLNKVFFLLIVTLCHFSFAETTPLCQLNSADSDQSLEAYHSRLTGFAGHLDFRETKVTVGPLQGYTRACSDPLFSIPNPNDRSIETYNCKVCAAALNRTGTFPAEAPSTQNSSVQFDSLMDLGAPNITCDEQGYDLSLLENLTTDELKAIVSDIKEKTGSTTLSVDLLEQECQDSTQKCAAYFVIASQKIKLKYCKPNRKLVQFGLHNANENGLIRSIVCTTTAHNLTTPVGFFQLYKDQTPIGQFKCDALDIQNDNVTTAESKP